MPRTPVSKSLRHTPTPRPGIPAPKLPEESLSPARPTPSPPLPEPIEPTPGAMMLATGSAAVYQKLRSSMHPGGFQQYEGNLFPLALINERDATGTIEMKPPHIDGLAILPADEMEALASEMFRQSRELSQLEADTLDALCHLWLKQAQHPEMRVVADVNELLALRGLKPKKGGSGRRGGYMPEQRREMLQALARIQNLWLRIDELSTYTENGGKSKKNRRETRRGVTGPAFVLTGAGGQIRLDGSLDVDRVSFTPGDVLALYLWGPGRQTALIDAKALRFDPYRQEPEKMLARYLSWLWKIRSTKGAYREPLRVGTLLEQARIEINERMSRKPSLALQRLEKALDTLQEEGIIASWSYKSWDIGNAPARGWLERWLQELVIIEPPESVVSHYMANLRGALPDGETAPLADRLRETRERLQLSQAEAAEACTLTQQTYSRAERGAGVSKASRQKLEAWLSANAMSKTASE